MKLAHIGDSHWGFGYPGPNPASRFDDISRVMEWCGTRIIDEACDAVLFAGDAFKDSKVWLDRASVEILAFASWLRRLAGAGIPVVAISGTPSHDAVPAYELIRQMDIPRVTIMTRDDVVDLEGLRIGCLPGVNRSSLVTRDQLRDCPPREIHRIMSDILETLCAGMAVEKDATVLLSHMTLAGADTGFDEMLLEHEPVLTHRAVSPFSLVCLGHIHRPQQVLVGSDTRAFYCGAPERLTFNDEGYCPGFWIHDTDAGESRFIETPARRFVSVDSLRDVDVRGAIVRARFEMTPEQAKTFDRKAYERSLYEAGAFFVSEIRVNVDQKQDRARDREVTEGLGPIQAVERWGQANGKEDEEIRILQSMAGTLVEEVA